MAAVLWAPSRHARVGLLNSYCWSLVRVLCMNPTILMSELNVISPGQATAANILGAVTQLYEPLWRFRRFSIRTQL